MSVNKYLPHVLVLPEDDANHQLATGFQLDQSLATRKMQILGEAGGWLEVLNRFQADLVLEMNRYPNRFIVLLIDFDERENRLTRVREAIPNHLRERVFVLGSLSNPEKLRQEFGETYENIGLAMAKDCRENTDVIWSHDLLRHNADELQRLRNHIRPILFPAGS